LTIAILLIFYKVVNNSFLYKYNIKNELHKINTSKVVNYSFLDCEKVVNYSF